MRTDLLCVRSCFAVAVAMVLASCAPAATTSRPVTAVPTTAATTAPIAATTAVPTTEPAEKPQYGGTLNLVMIADITSWDQGLTFC
jgi:type IV pilus biogenesis protein CpaD/CtpE